MAITIPNLCTFPKYITMLSGIIIMTVGGTYYNFSAYAPDLKALMGFQQVEIMLIGTAANIGNLLGFVPSLIFDVFGPRPTILFASVTLFISYFLQFLLAFAKQNQITWIPTSFYFFVFAAFLCGNGSSAVYTAALGTNLKNFSLSYRGIVTGSLVGMLGLCGAVFASVYAFVFVGNVTIFLLFCSILCGVVPMVFGFPFLNVINEKNPSLLQRFIQVIKNKKQSSTIVTETPVASINTSEEETNTEEEEVKYLLSNSSEKSDSIPPIVQHNIIDYNPFQMLLTLDFWLLFIMCFCVIGTGYMNINNMGSIAKSFEFEQGHDFVIMISIFSCVGKLVIGFLSDKLARFVSRTGFFLLCIIVIGFCQFVYMYAMIEMYYAIVPIFSIAYGGIWALLPAILRDRYGSKFFALNLTVLQIAPACASLLIATLMTSAIYQSHIAFPGGNNCYGRSCYQLAFLLCFCFCGVAIVVGFKLMHSTSKMYTSLFKAKSNNNNNTAK